MTKVKIADLERTTTDMLTDWHTRQRGHSSDQKTQSQPSGILLLFYFIHVFLSVINIVQYFSKHLHFFWKVTHGKSNFKIIPTFTLNFPTQRQPLKRCLHNLLEGFTGTQVKGPFCLVAKCCVSYLTDQRFSEISKLLRRSPLKVSFLSQNSPNWMWKVIARA